MSTNNLIGARLEQGDSHFLSLTAGPFAGLSNGHPLKANGLQTAGFTTTLYGSFDPKGDRQDASLRVVAVPTSATAATFTLLPAATSALAMSGRTIADVWFQVEIASDDHRFTLRFAGETRQRFTLRADS